MMAFTKDELLHGQSVTFGIALRGCDSYWWPYSLLLRWMVGKDNKRMVKRIEKHCAVDLAVEMDNVTSNIGQYMKNIGLIQGGKGGDT